MVWNDLVRVALIGTDNSKLSEATLKFLESKGIDIDNPPAEILLEATAYFSTLQKVAGDLPLWKKQDFTQTISEQKTIPLNKESTKHLNDILQGDHEEALEEFVFLMVKNKKHLPGEFLPEIFDECLTNNQLWKQIKKTIGGSGSWLLQQNKNWFLLTDNIYDADWYSATRLLRIKILESIRKVDPSQAIPLITTTWEVDDPADRVKYLKVFKINLSNEDEDFLESCLDDKRKEVRQTAAILLRNLPESRLQVRILKTLENYLFFKNKKLTVKLPAALSDELIRDGIQPKFKYFSGGLKANRLGQMIASINPKYLEQFFSNAPSKIFNLFNQTEFKELFIHAISDSALIHKNQSWMKEILKIWMNEQELDLWDEVDIFAMIRMLDEITFNDLCDQAIQFHKTLPEEDDAITFLLIHGEQDWGEKITFKYIRLLQKWMASEVAEYWGGWHAKKVLRAGAYKIDIEHIQELRKGWPINANIWPNWEEDIRQFFEVLKFRKEMKEALEV